MSKDTALGRLLRQKRLERGWHVALAAELYGEAVCGRPVKKGTIHAMEEGRVPNNPKRRWVLARMYGLAPAALGLQALKHRPVRASLLVPRRRQSVDLQEYRETILTYWKQGYPGSAQDALKDLGSRIYALHDTAFYSPRKQDMLQLLCAYHMRRAEVVRELGYEAAALDHINKAIVLAHEEDLPVFEAVALYRRGEYYYDKRDFPRALRDLAQAQALVSRSPAPPQVKGRIVNVKGLVEASLAQSGSEMLSALKLVDLSEKFVGRQIEDDLYALNLNMPRFLLNKAKALVGPVAKKLHEPDEVLNLVEEIGSSNESAAKRLYTYHLMGTFLIQALAYIDKRCYPIATTMALETVELSEQINSTIYLPTLNVIYDELRESPYGNEADVAELGIRLLFLEYPQLARGEA